MATLSNTECRQRALDLLARSEGYAVNSPARVSTLAEAQVYATLALDAPQSAPAPKARTRKATPAKSADAEVQEADK